jgi:hypothetical protein
MSTIEDFLCIFDEEQCVIQEEDNQEEDNQEEDNQEENNEIIMDEFIKEGSFIINYKLKKYLDQEIIIYK